MGTPVAVTIYLHRIRKTSNTSDHDEEMPCCTAHVVLAVITVEVQCNVYAGTSGDCDKLPTQRTVALTANALQRYPICVFKAELGALHHHGHCI